MARRHTPAPGSAAAASGGPAGAPLRRAAPARPLPPDPLPADTFEALVGLGLVVARAVLADDAA
ncbi:MAG: hypothetical protein AB7H93_23430 [Vicinamibacterales bacterium]